MGAISPFSLRRMQPSLPPCVPQHSLHYSTVSYHSLTAILISRFLIDLQEANLRSVKVDSDDPAFISSYSENSLPSFVARGAPGTARPALGTSVEHHIESGVLDNGETGGAYDMEDEMLRVEMPSVEGVEVEA